jgi:hypothetical protein
VVLGDGLFEIRVPGQEPVVVRKGAAADVPKPHSKQVRGAAARLAEADGGAAPRLHGAEEGPRDPE